MKKTSSKLILSQLPQLSNNQMLVVCKSCGNPDHGQYAPLSEPEYFAVDCFEQASAACTAYINMWDLGGGNWTGGAIYDKSGVLVAQVSYNGRVWKGDKNETSVELNHQTIVAFHHHYQSEYDKMMNEYAASMGIAI